MAIRWLCFVVMVIVFVVLNQSLWFQYLLLSACTNITLHSPHTLCCQNFILFIIYCAVFVLIIKFETYFLSSIARQKLNFNGGYVLGGEGCEANIS